MITVEGLTKYYGDRAAIRDLRFSIEKGEVVGFLGLNGAGKSTTLKVLGCVLLPTSGRVTIDGVDLATNSHQLKRRIGFLPDTPPLYEEMTVEGYLRFVAQLRGVRPEAVAGRVAAVLETASLEAHREDVISSLSHGYRQRVGVAQALVHEPDLLILDEPTSGLDPVQIKEMRELIRGLKGAHTVLVSSHILSEISQVCDRYLVIQAGELIAQGSEEDLARQLGGGAAVEVELAGPCAAAAPAVEALAGVSAVTQREGAGGRVLLAVQGEGELRPRVVAALVGAGAEVLRVDRAQAQLERIFLELTRR
jgi:ABC-2 type transport system ATP-binding protein